MVPSKDAYMYDVEYNSVQTFKFLTPQHFEPGSAEKMCNYLADDVLGKRMVEIVQVKLCKLVFCRIYKNG